MKHFYTRAIFFAFFIIYACKCNDYETIDLKLKKEEASETPLYFELNDKCGRWTPALFYEKEPKECQFGLKFTDDVSGEKNNTIKYLLNNKIIKKNIFSFGKWEEDEEYIKSKLYIRDKHENFSKDNIATCKLQKDKGLYGCIFDNFTFLEQTYNLKEKYYEPFTIYFSPETTYIHMHKRFEKIVESVLGIYILYRNEPRPQNFEPLILRSGDLSLTLEVDYFDRYLGPNAKIAEKNLLKIKTHDESDNFIIFPMSMFKNFHVQFDVDNNEISFYSENSSLIQNKKKENPEKLLVKELQPESTPEAVENKDTDSIYVKLIVIFSGVLLAVTILLLAYRYNSAKKKLQDKEIEKRMDKIVFKFEDLL